eukprot:14471255-Ditylum_brightwellii.AAC.1
MKALRNVRNWKKTKEKFGIKILGDTEEELLIEERKGGSKWIASKTAIIDLQIKWERDNYWLTTIKMGSSLDIPVQVCTQVYISWIEGKTPDNNQVRRGN